MNIRNVLPIVVLSLFVLGAGPSDCGKSWGRICSGLEVAAETIRAIAAKAEFGLVRARAMTAAACDPGLTFAEACADARGLLLEAETEVGKARAFLARADAAVLACKLGGSSAVASGETGDQIKRARKELRELERWAKRREGRSQ